MLNGYPFSIFIFMLKLFFKHFWNYCMVCKTCYEVSNQYCRRNVFHKFDSYKTYTVNTEKAKRHYNCQCDIFNQNFFLAATATTAIITAATILITESAITAF